MINTFIYKKKLHFALAFLVGLIVWVFDSVIDYFTFQSFSGNFLDMILNPPSHELYERLVVLISVMVFLFVLLRIYLGRFERDRIIVNQSKEIGALFESIGDAVVSTDVTGLITRVNPIAKRMVATPSSNIIGYHIDEVYHFVDSVTLGRTESRVKDVLHTSIPITLGNHTALIFKDGTIHHISNSVAPIVNENGQTLGAVFVFRDISEIKKIQLELEEHKFQLETAQSVGEMGSWELNLKNGLVNASKEAYRLYGIDPRSRLTISDIRSVPMVEYRTTLDEALKALIKKGEKYHQVFEIKQINSGDTLWIESQAIYNKELHIVTGIVRNVTERVENEKALRLSEKRLRIATEGTNDGLWDLNMETNELYISGRYADILGYDKSELSVSNEDWLKLMHPDDRDGTVEILNNYLEHRISEYNVVFRLRAKSGLYKWISSRGNAIWNEKGMAIRIIGFHTDITVQKNAQLALRSSEQRFNSVLEYSPMGLQIYMLDSNNELIFIDYNDANSVLLGVNSEDFMGLGISDSFPQLMKSEIPVKFKRAALYGEPYQTEYLIHKEDKIIGAFEVHAFQIEKGKVCAMFFDILERKIADDKLSKSEERYRLLLNSQTDMVVKVDIDGRFVFANPSYCEMFDKTEDELIGNSFMPFVHEDDKVSTTEEMRKLYVPPYQCRFRQRVLSKHGWRWVEWQDTALLDDDNNVSEIIGVGRDITEQVEARAELNKSEQRNKQIIQELMLGIVIHVGNEIVNCNATMQRMLGYDDGELDGLNILEFVYPDDRMKLNDHIYNVSLGKHKSPDYKPAVFKLRLICRNKSVLVAEVSIISTRFNDKDAMMLVMNDITEWEESQKKQSAFTAFIENSNDIIMIKDLNRRLIAANDMFVKVWGYDDLEEILGKTDAEVFGITEDEWPADVYKQEDLAALRLPPGEIFVTESYVEYKNTNERRYVHTRKYPIRDIRGNVFALGVVSTDITDQKIAEANLKLKNEEYLAANEELNESLSHIQEINKELKVAKEKAEESDRLKSAFLANMSHEIRTPMNSILGFAQMLQKPLLADEKQRKYISIIRKSGKRMLSTINDLMDISRIEAGHVKVGMSYFDVVEQFRYLLALFSDEANRKGLVLSCEINMDERVMLFSDKAKVEAVLINLIKNAIKYTDVGFINIGYKVENENLLFFVADSGIGIPADKVDVVFDRFVQADVEDKEVREGTGLGLSISRAYVEMLEGKIWVLSEVGKGSVFSFSIPQRK